jgi:carboxyl-terminal processing protease
MITQSRTSTFFVTSTVFSALFFGVGVGLLLSDRAPELLAREKIDESLITELKTFTDVLAMVQENYVREVNGKQLASGAIKGMMSALDPHSAYLDPQYFEEMQSQTRGDFGGLGIEIVAPMEGTPAARVGIKSGDVIVKIDGEYLKEVSLVDVVKRLRGPTGTSVTLSVMRKNRPGKLKEYSITRDKIVIKSIKHRYLSDGYGYVRISQFMETTGDDLLASISELTKQAGGALRGLVLDLRNNPGGLLTQAVKVSDVFLREGIIVSTKGRIASQEQKFYAHENETQPEYPLVVVINGGSASASEIVSGALKDHGRALVVGRQSFGKGSVQTINPLNNGGAVQLTTALYYTPSGRSIQALGVTPDIELPLDEVAPTPDDTSEDGVVSYSERDLPGAISNPLNKGNESKKELKKPAVKATEDLPVSVDSLDTPTWLARDSYARRALEILKTVNVLGKKAVVK